VDRARLRRAVRAASVLLAASAAALFAQLPTPWEEPPPTSSAERELPPHEFFFTRAAYQGGGWRGGRWTTDYPKADRQFLVGLRRLVKLLDAYEGENPVRLDDPGLRHYPFLYAVEVGYMSLSEEEVIGLRSYLEAGGFLVVDDFWGTREWASFESQIRRVLPACRIVDLPMDHPVFSSFYEIKEVLQVPNVYNALSGGPTWERDGFVPACRGIFDESGRLVVAINWNTDLGDAWEWAENPAYPLKFSTYAYQMGVNLIVYAMSH
jgi:hypothetical protein